MATLVDHLRLNVLIDGLIQVKLTNATVSLDSGNQPVETLEGLAGKTPGSGRVEINATWVIEPGGPETDVFQHVFDGTIHEIQIPVGAKSLVSRGWFQTSGISQSVNANTEVTATFTGDLKQPV